MLIIIVFATLIVSLISLLGIFILFKQKNKAKFLRALISLAAGALLAVSFFDLLPEAIEAEAFDPHVIFAVVLGSILFFFILEILFHWHHCRCQEHGKPSSENKNNLIAINLTGDAIHNFVDGILIASAFLTDFNLGILVTLAVILHEIPQEISDFGVLLYAGLSKTKALLANFLVAIVAILGAITFYFFGQFIEGAVPIMLAFAAGNFIYLAAADLIPELHHEKSSKKVFLNSLWLFAGVILIYLAGQVVPHGH
ncbi:MAG: ZIP family metal transporter [Patescibacteria group bacterium]|nr:ZIP family metal transporter [Patescibacteria group bacterium]